VNYSFNGFSADASCTTAPPGQQRENFVGTVTDSGQSISGATLSFSICNNPGSFAGAIFSLTVGPSVLQGTITATDLGDTIANGFDTETASGSFLVTSGTGDFTDSVGYNDVFGLPSART
jgi:hypothetical protein